jgi:hypothetical protein
MRPGFAGAGCDGCVRGENLRSHATNPGVHMRLVEGTGPPLVLHGGYTFDQAASVSIYLPSLTKNRNEVVKGT